MREPEALAARPRWGRLPIPFVTASNNVGVPDFRSHDFDRRRMCADHRLCQLCGQDLSVTFVFVAFEQAVARLRTGEPPMHRDCMEYAWSICPWLANRRAWEAEWGDASPVLPRPPTEPQTMAIIEASGYEYVPDQTGLGIWRIHGFIRVDYRERGGHG